MTDLLGVLESWGDRTITVRDEAGKAVVIERRSIVSGKPVPPRPSVRSRIPADQVALRAADSWPAIDVEHVGDWLLRASAGFSLRANSALVAGDPGVSFDDAVRSVVEFYASRGLPPQVQVVVGSPPMADLERRGWMALVRSGAGVDVEVQLAAVSQVSRAVRRALPGGAPPVRLDDQVTDAWLASDRRALDHLPASVTVLQGPDEVTFASVLSPDGRVLAKGRAALSALPRQVDPWAGVTDLWVDPARRRQGLARVVLAELLSWSAERGATTAYLQTTTDNHGALALYRRLGFVTHHTYRYLELP
jgi:ribosomal protein S18 acetylase RimI-like enzyme